MSSFEKNTFFAVAFLHLLVGIGVFFEFHKPAVAPVLSFSVTMVDVSGNHNNISSTAIASSNRNQKNNRDSKLEKRDNYLQSKKANEAIESKDYNTKSKSNNVVNSIQQDAVFSTKNSVNLSAAYLQNPTPPYPPLSRRLGEQGKVILNVYVNKDGTTQNISIFKSSGFSRLDDSALNTVKNWRFIAAKQGEQLVPSQVQVPINFILDSNE